MYDQYLVFDVESVGLHGEGFAVGYVVVGKAGDILEEGMFACKEKYAKGTPDNRRWVVANVIAEPNLSSPKEVRDAFWTVWSRYRSSKCALIADCAWPVEARFLNQCVDDYFAEREWQGPYPLHDLASILLMAGQNPLAKTKRLPNELPEHNPLNDARQSARQLIEALKKKST